MVNQLTKDKNVLNKVDSYMSKVYDTPEVFVGSTTKVQNSMTDIMSNLYLLAKKNETLISEKPTDALDSLVTKGFDGEQIWAQLQLYNDPILKELESKVDNFTKSSEELEILTGNDQSDGEDDDDESDFDFDLAHDDYQESDLEDDLTPSQEEDDQDLEDEDDFEDEDSLGEEEEEEEQIKKKPTTTKNTNKKETTATTKKSSKNNVGEGFFGKDGGNADFFDAKEMEKFLDDEDDNEYQRREDEEDDDQDDELGDSDEDDGGLQLPEVELDDEERALDSLLDKYMEDNADEMEREKQESAANKSKKSKKQVVDPSKMKFDDFFSNPEEKGDDKYDEDEFSMDGLNSDDEEGGDDDFDGEDGEEDEEDQEEGEDSEQEKETVEEEVEEATLPPEELSSFQKRAQRIQIRIKELEQANLKKKDWTLVGETSSKERPKDSLLGEVLDYDHTQRATPTITEETNKTIDDIIKKRILEKNFDDVIRKTEKEFKDNYKKKVEMNDEKSTEGLGDVYEKDYMKQVLGVEQTDELKSKHVKIYQYFNKLCYKLDSLTNFQYTPKKIKNKELNITTANALTMEEKIPVATSTSTIIAPEEVYFKKNADEKGESELSKEDRDKNRKKYKKQWKDEKEEKEFKERLQKKVDPTSAKKTTIAANLAHLKQASNVTIVDTKKSEVRSGDFRSNQTFAKIQRSEENKRKGIEDPNSHKSKKKAKLDALQSSTFKL